MPPSQGLATAYLSIHNLFYRHLLILILDRTAIDTIDAIDRARQYGKAISHRCFLPIDGRAIRAVGGRAVRRYGWGGSCLAGRENVLSEEECLRAAGITKLSALHVFVDLHVQMSSQFCNDGSCWAYLGNRNVEVQIKCQHRSRQENHKNRESSVLKIGHLHFHGAKLNAPPDM